MLNWKKVATVIDPVNTNDTWTSVLWSRLLNSVSPRLFGRARKRFKSLRAKAVKQEIAGKFFPRARLVIVILVITLPVVLSFFFVKTYGVNVVFWDQWEIVPLFDKFFTGHLSFADLFARHNEHRIFFPRVVMLLLGVITHYNNVAEMYFSWFLIVLASYVLFTAYIRTFGCTEGTLIKFIPVVWLLFSLRQWENLLWGFQIQFYMVILFVLLALYLLETSKSLGWRFALSGVSGVIATFSLGNGLLIWPIGLVQILCTYRLQTKELRRLYLKMATVWSLAGIFLYIVYFIGYTKPSHHPISSLGYLLACIGSPLAIELYTALGMGLLLLLLFICVGGLSIRNKLNVQPSTPFCLSLVLFALLSAALLVLTRSGLGVEQALSSRYTTIMALGIVGLYLLIMSLKVRHENVKTFFFGFLVSLVVLGVVTSGSHALVEDGKELRVARNAAAYYLSTYQLQSDEKLTRLYPDAQAVRERARILEKYKLNVFSEDRLELEALGRTSSTTLFYIHTINGRLLSQQASPIVIDAQREETVTISGWAVDQHAEKTAGGVFITINDRIDIPAIYGLDRPDVADYFKNPHYRFSGFSASFATAVLGKGQHTLTLKIVTMDKKGYYQPDQKIILEVR